MRIRGLIISIALICCCTACSEPNQIQIERQSFVRWYASKNELEVYAVVYNSAKHDVSFQASFIFLDEKLKEAVGVQSEQLITDDRNNRSPFNLASFKETVFHRKYKTHGELTPDMLSQGVGIEITDQHNTYTIAIKHGEVEKR